MAGTLFLIPCRLSGESPAREAIPQAAIERIHALDTFVVENAKSARAFLFACGHPKALREIAMSELNEHTPAAALDALLAPLRAGKDVGLLSEAGAPAVADPGARLVAAAHAHDVRVVPLVGPSSLLLALMASGLEGQRFRFVGYLPAKPPERRAKIVEIETESGRRDETQLFIETPYRNDALLADILGACRDDTRLAVAADLTGGKEWIRSDEVRSWKSRASAIGKRPAVFLLLARPRAKR